MTVAVVDDEPVVRDAYRAFFAKRAVFQFVGEAADGRSGVQLFLEKLPDVMMMDLRMPGMSGVDAIAEICDQVPSACVIALTTFGTLEFISAALRAGAAGYLMKDCSPDELGLALHQAMAGDMPLSSGVRRALVDSITASHGMGGHAPLMTPREIEVLQLLGLGLTNPEIARKLGLSEGSIKQYLNHIAEKFGVHSRTQVLVRALQLQIVDLDSLP